MKRLVASFLLLALPFGSAVRADDAQFRVAVSKFLKSATAYAEQLDRGRTAKELEAAATVAMRDFGAIPSAAVLPNDAARARVRAALMPVVHAVGGNLLSLWSDGDVRAQALSRRMILNAVARARLAE